MTTHQDRPSLNRVAVPIVGEFLLGMSVAMAGLYLASDISDAVAGAFGLVQQVVETLLVVFRVLAIGLGVVVTQRLGNGDVAQAARSAYTALAASTWAGLAVALWLCGAGGLTLSGLNAPAAIWPMALSYMVWLAPALWLEAYNLSMAAVLRAHLYARESFYVMVVMHGSHLLCATVLVRGVGAWDGLGLEGYALAWALSRALGLALHLWLWHQRMALRPLWSDWWRVSGAVLAPVLRIGLPGAALEMVYRLGFMVSVSAVARLGVEALATHSYTLQILKYVLLISMSIGWACEIMVGRLVGAGRLRQADDIVRKGVRNGMLASGGLACLAALLSPWLLRVFTHDPQIIALAQTLLWCSVALELGRVFNLVVIGALRAAGDVNYPVLASVGSLVLVLGLGSYMLGREWGLVGVWLAYVADEGLRGLLMWRRWRRCGWLPHAHRTVRQLRRS